jgi:hypothetical protein
MSSRHVIKSSAADLVPIECYTKSFRKQCKKASTSDSFEKRYKDVLVVDAEPPAALAKYKCPPERLPTVARLVAVIRKATELFNVIMITVVADSSGYVTTAGPWLRSEEFRRSSHGLMCVRDGDKVSLMQPLLLASSYRSLLDFVIECLHPLTWPLVESTLCVKRAEVGDRKLLRSMVVTSWVDVATVSLPFRYDGPRSASASAAGPTIEDDLVKILLEEYGSDAGDDLDLDVEDIDVDDGGGCGAGGLGRIDPDDVADLEKIAQDMQDDNPPMGPEDAVVAAVEELGAVDDESESSSSSSSSSSSDSSDDDTGGKKTRCVTASLYDRVDWDDEWCLKCGAHVGQMKLLDGEEVGGRVPKYAFRAYDENSMLPIKGRFHKTRRVTRDGCAAQTRLVAQEWIQEKRRCCPMGS